MSYLEDIESLIDILRKEFMKKQRKYIKNEQESPQSVNRMQDNADAKVEIWSTMNETKSLYETNDNEGPLHILYEVSKLEFSQNLAIPPAWLKIKHRDNPTCGIDYEHVQSKTDQT